MKNNTRQTLKFYLQHATKYKFSFSLTLLSIVSAVVLTVIRPLYFKEFFDVLAGQSDKEIGFNVLVSILIILTSISFLEWVFWRIATFGSVNFYGKTISDLYATCFGYLHSHSMNFFESTFVGSLIKKVNRFVWSFNDILDTVLWNLLNMVINIVLISIVLFYKNYVLGLIVITWTFIFLLVNGLFTRYKIKYDIMKSKADTEISQVLADTVTNQINVKLFNGINNEKELFANKLETARLRRTTSWNLENIMEAIQGFMMVCLELVILYVALLFWKKGIFTVGDFVLLQTYVLHICNRVWGFGRVVRSIYRNLSDAEEMTEILLEPHEIRDSNRAYELKVKKAKIKFDSVSFCYNKTRKVIDNLNLIIKNGEKVALVGPSGAGKSTIVKLLLRMHDVSRGKILIDCQKIKDVTQHSLWNNLSMVPQDPILFHRSLKENIRYGKPGASDKEVEKASKLANCHEFINGLSEGYDTKVGERGIKLSGGERQRVAIARAILKNSPILILDEATSSLDSEAESLIQGALDNLMKNKTVIVIAHRLSTIMKVDRIIVLKEGKIFEQGSHTQLLKKEKGLYSRLWKIQAGGFIK